MNKISALTKAKQVFKLVKLVSKVTLSRRGLAFLMRAEHLFSVFSATGIFPRISWAQDSEDIFIFDLIDQLDIMNNFVDIGAHHPHRFSTTYLLYQKGWRGINVDYPESTIQLFQKFRPLDTTVKALVGTPRTATYFQFEESALNTIVQDVAEYQERLGYSLRKTETVEIQSMSAILRDCGAPAKIGLLSIDVEGAEMEILQDLLRSGHSFDLILIELGKDSSRNSIANAMSNSGYTRIVRFKRSALYVAQHLVPQMRD